MSSGTPENLPGFGISTARHALSQNPWCSRLSAASRNSESTRRRTDYWRGPPQVPVLPLDDCKRILSERAGVSPETAVRLGKFCANGAGIWLRLQQAHDHWLAERSLREELEKIPSHRAA